MFLSNVITMQPTGDLASKKTLTDTESLLQKQQKGKFQRARRWYACFERLKFTLVMAIELAESAVREQKAEEGGEGGCVLTPRSSQLQPSCPPSIVAVSECVLPFNSAGMSLLYTTDG